MLVSKYYYEFPVIETPAKSGATLYWQIFAGLVDIETTNNFAEKETPEILPVLSKLIRDEYDNNARMDPKLKGYIISATWKEGGDRILKKATFVTSGKNENKANRTNTWTQTLKEAQSKYDKRNKPNEKSDVLLPMLAGGDAITAENLNQELVRVYNKYKDNFRVQIKFDGQLLLIKMQEHSPLFPYSRQGDRTTISDVLFEELVQMNKKIFHIFPNYARHNIYLVGEYYAHGQKLQNISGAIRNESQSDLKSSLIYYVFDIVATTKDGDIIPDECKTRLWNLKLLRDGIADLKLGHVNITESFQPSSSGSLKKLFLDAQAKGYEGLMIKLLDRKYVPGSRAHVIKLKSSFREEFQIIGFKEGKGKHAGMIIFQCSLTPETINKAVEYFNSKGTPITEVDINNIYDNKFSVTPAVDEETRKLMFANGADYIGKMYTVEFQDWYNTLKPARPIGIEVRY